MCTIEFVGGSHLSFVDIFKLRRAKRVHVQTDRKIETLVSSDSDKSIHWTNTLSPIILQLSIDLLYSQFVFALFIINNP